MRLRTLIRLKPPQNVMLASRHLKAVEKVVAKHGKKAKSDWRKIKDVAKKIAD